MGDESTVKAGIPAWYWVAAGLALLFEATGCFMYVAQVSADRATLPLDQRAMWDATPSWMVAAYAIGVWVGLAGAALLLLRRKLAVPFLLVSLLAVIVQFSGLFLVLQLRQTVPDTALAAPIAILVICYGIFHLARLADRRGWLR